VRIVFEISGDRQIERELLRIGDRAADASPAFDRIIDLWASETAQQFQSEGAHASGGWAPLAPSTLARKRTLFGGGRILHQTGTLESSLTDRGDPNMIVQISRDEVAWGSRGSATRSSTRPARRGCRAAGRSSSPRPPAARPSGSCSASFSPGRSHDRLRPDRHRRRRRAGRDRLR
jgi:hypothetical protein